MNAFYTTVATPTVVRYESEDYYVMKIDPQAFTATLVGVNNATWTDVVKAEDFDKLQVVETPMTLSVEQKPTA